MKPLTLQTQKALVEALEKARGFIENSASNISSASGGRAAKVHRGMVAEIDGLLARARAEQEQ